MFKTTWLLGAGLNLSTPAEYLDFPKPVEDLSGVSLENPRMELRAELASRVQVVLKQAPFLECGVFYSAGLTEGQYIQTGGLDCDLGIEWDTKRHFSTSLGLEQDFFFTPVVHLPCIDGVCFELEGSKSTSLWGRGLPTLQIATSVFLNEDVNLEASLGLSPALTMRKGTIYHEDGTIMLYSNDWVGSQWVLGIQANRAF